MSVLTLLLSDHLCQQYKNNAGHYENTRDSTSFTSKGIPVMALVDERKFGGKLYSLYKFPFNRGIHLESILLMESRDNLLLFVVSSSW